jgi:hypothetical protein
MYDNIHTWEPVVTWTPLNKWMRDQVEAVEITTSTKMNGIASMQLYFSQCGIIGGQIMHPTYKRSALAGALQFEVLVMIRLPR